MALNDAIHTRLDSLETAVRLVDRVVALADFMERLVVREERNSFVSTHVKEVKGGFKEPIGELKTQEGQEGGAAGADEAPGGREEYLPPRRGMIALILASLRKYLLMEAAAAALLYGAYLYGHHVSEEEHARAALAQKINDLNLGIAITAADHAKLVEQQSRIDALKKELAGARTKISCPDDTCFEPGDVDGLLDIWPKPAAFPDR